MSRYCAHNFAMCYMYMFSCSYRHSFHWRRKMDDLIADAAISLVPSSKQTGHCTNTCQSVIVLFSSVSHVLVCLHESVNHYRSNTCRNFKKIVTGTTDGGMLRNKVLWKVDFVEKIHMLFSSVLVVCGPFYGGGHHTQYLFLKSNYIQFNCNK